MATPITWKQIQFALDRNLKEAEDYEAANTDNPTLLEETLEMLEETLAEYEAEEEEFDDFETPQFSLPKDGESIWNPDKDKEEFDDGNEFPGMQNID
jgi:hypothetical protein